MKKYDVMIFSAHPDDAEFAIGGTILKLTKVGKKVINIIFTKGQKGTYGSTEERVEEMKSASSFGNYDYEFLDYIDCEIEYNHSTIIHIAKIIRKYKPKIVLAPYHTSNFGPLDGMSHIDHLAVGKIAKDGSKLARIQNTIPEIKKHQINQILYYMVPKNIVPTFVMDVSDVIEDFKELIKCFKTQMNIVRGERTVEDGLVAFRKMIGYSIFSRYAESFYSEDPIGFSEINSSVF